MKVGIRHVSLEAENGWSLCPTAALVETVFLNLYKHAEPLCSFPSFCRTPFLPNKKITFLLKTQNLKNLRKRNRKPCILGYIFIANQCNK